MNTRLRGLVPWLALIFLAGGCSATTLTASKHLSKDDSSVQKMAYDHYVSIHRESVGRWRVERKYACGNMTIQEGEDGSVAGKREMVLSPIGTVLPASDGSTDVSFDESCSHVYWIAKNKRMIYEMHLKTRAVRSIPIHEALFPKEVVLKDEGVAHAYFPTPIFLYAYGGGEDSGSGINTHERLLVSFQNPSRGTTGERNGSSQAVYDLQTKEWRWLNR